MSSMSVRQKIKDFLTANAPTEVQADLTSQFDYLTDFLEVNNIAPDSPWLGLQFIGSDEVPITILATNDQGRYREEGAIYFHIVDVAKLGVGDSLLVRGEALRNLLRGRRIDNIIIESVTPMNFDSGATLRFEGGYMSGSFAVSYQMDLEL